MHGARAARSLLVGELAEDEAELVRVRTGYLAGFLTRASEAARDAEQADDIIVVALRSGIVEQVRFPAGARTPVRIVDYDTEGTIDDLSPGIQGEPCGRSEWSPEPA